MEKHEIIAIMASIIFAARLQQLDEAAGDEVILRAASLESACKLYILTEKVVAERL